MRALTMTYPQVRLALVTDLGGRRWERPLADLTSLAVGAWVCLILIEAVAQVVQAAAEWGLAYSALLSTLLVILLSALLWALAPRPPGRDGRKGASQAVGRGVE
jgi:hypothetical protein